jgi:lipopolysaccharide/colanic/teichoic acid biosynthesis glycosyltransferase
MTRIRLELIFAVCWFVLLFTVERLDLFVGQQFNIATTVYITVILTSIVILLFPRLAQENLAASLAVLLAFYVVSRTVFYHSWEISRFFWYAFEFGTIVVSFLIMRQIGQTVVRFERALKAFLLPKQQLRDGTDPATMELIEREFYRARRFEKPMTVVYSVLANEDSDKDREIQLNSLKWRISDDFHRQYDQVKMAQVLEDLTSKSDIVVAVENGVALVLPETELSEATDFAGEISQAFRTRLHAQAVLGIAQFPDDGLLFEDLVQQAKNGARVQPEGSSTSNRRRGNFKIEPERRMKIDADTEWINRLDNSAARNEALYRFTKRLLDIAIVGFLIPFFLPLFSLIALAIFLDDPGPVFYMQQRTGYGGKRFKLYKFRSMYANAQAQPAKRVEYEDGSVRYLWPEKVDNDKRITRVGRILRKTSLDELPQLLNVLLGDMTLIGPRPTSWDLNMYTLQQTERLTVRPGITGLWQVCARESTNFDERVMWDIKYIEHMSLWLDIQILWRTASQVLHRGGA